MLGTSAVSVEPALFYRRLKRTQILCLIVNTGSYPGLALVS